MKDTGPTNPKGSALSAGLRNTASSLFQGLKGKRVAYLTIPLLVMATVTEFVILATGWKYQQAVCLPQGMGVTFFGIGPIGATILAVELLKLPLAAWTASRTGFAKGFMLFAGLPLICVLTFQLVKDMAVYEMGTAMAPATAMLEKASVEENKIAQLKGDLEAIEGKKADRELKLAELADRKTKAKAELEETLKRNEASRQDAITLTDYQKKELSEVQARQDAIIMQFNSDTAQLTKALAGLRSRREIEVGRATKWNVEEARIENDYKAKLAEYTNTKTAYEKDKAKYDSANFVKRKLMREPVAPGVPPEREANKILKPVAIAGIDAQIKVKEAELAAINNKRRERVAQVDADARQLREDFDRRSSTKREETDTKREELLAAQALLAVQWKAEQEQIDQQLATSVQKVDGIRAEIDSARNRAEGFYEAREAAIRDTQVHRIATTVEIVRGLLMGERPMSITTTAKARGDILTDQISMVRIWVYPVLAFIVAFLPTLMVEIGFSTLFKPEQARPAHRLGFLGRRLHWLYTRAGRLKILRAERLASEGTIKLAARNRTLTTEKAAAEAALGEKDAELQTARQTLDAAAVKHDEQVRQKNTEHEAELEQKEAAWVAKFADLADSLNRAVVEKDTLKDLQKSEIERQIQMRQNAWSDRLTQLRQELDDQRAAAETERTSLIQEHHQKMMELSETSKAQVIQARRQMADAELATVETSTKLAHDLKEALHARDTAESQLKQQADSFSLQLAQTQEHAAREIEKAARQDKHRLERQQLDSNKALQLREEDFQHQLKQVEQKLSVGFEARLSEEKTRGEEEARRRETEVERQFEAHARQVDARWKQEVQQREDAANTRLKQREQQLQAQVETRLNETREQAEQESRRRESEFEHKLADQLREAEARSKQELQQKELNYHATLKQREKELTHAAAERESALQTQWASDLRVRQEEWERQAEARVRATESSLSEDVQQKEEQFQSQLRQQDQKWQAKLDALQVELQARSEQDLRRRELESASVRQQALRELEARLREEMRQNEQASQTKAKQREQDLATQLAEQTQAHQTAAREWETELDIARGTIPAIKAVLVRTEKERDEARQSASESTLKVQNLEKKLFGASSLLSGWRSGNGDSLVEAGDDRSSG